MSFLFRDIHQLRDAPAYGVTALNGLFAAEAALEAAVKFVPYCNEHLDVWSPQFAQIILDSASQIDSIWKAAERTQDPTTATEKRTIRDHWNQYRAKVSEERVVFFGGSEPAVIHPFADWIGANFQSPTWWQAYNALKHDRFTNQTRATLSHAVSSVAGLLLAIVYSGVCDLALIAAQTLDTSRNGYNPWAFTSTGLLRDVPWQCRSIIESRLLVHPLGLFSANDCNLWSWWDSRSQRFNVWWALNCEKYTVIPKAGGE